MAVTKKFTPELIAHGRYRYENTDEPVASIAIDFDVHERTMRDYILQWKWTPRKERPPKGIAPLAALMMQSQQIPATEIVAQAASPPEVAAGEPAASDPASADTMANAPPVADPATEPAPAAAADERSAMVERLWRAASGELAAVERMRAQLGTQPQSPVDAERTARTLESLMRIAKEVDRLRGVNAVSAADDDDDLPRDLDEFRHALARRIHAFLDSRRDGGVSQPGPEAETLDSDRT
jgi:hypothetical protein